MYPKTKLRQPSRNRLPNFQSQNPQKSRRHMSCRIRLLMYKKLLINRLPTSLTQLKNRLDKFLWHNHLVLNNQRLLINMLNNLLKLQKSMINLRNQNLFLNLPIKQKSTVTKKSIQSQNKEKQGSQPSKPKQSSKTPQKQTAQISKEQNKESTNRAEDSLDSCLQALGDKSEQKKVAEKSASMKRPSPETETQSKAKKLKTNQETEQLSAEKNEKSTKTTVESSRNKEDKQSNIANTKKQPSANIVSKESQKITSAESPKDKNREQESSVSSDKQLMTKEQQSSASKNVVHDKLDVDKDLLNDSMDEGNSDDEAQAGETSSDARKDAEKAKSQENYTLRRNVRVDINRYKIPMGNIVLTPLANSDSDSETSSDEDSDQDKGGVVAESKQTSEASAVRSISRSVSRSRSGSESGGSSEDSDGSDSDGYNSDGYDSDVESDASSESDGEIIKNNNPGVEDRNDSSTWKSEVANGDKGPIKCFVLKENHIGRDLLFTESDYEKIDFCEESSSDESDGDSNTKKELYRLAFERVSKDLKPKAEMGQNGHIIQVGESLENCFDCYKPNPLATHNNPNYRFDASDKCDIFLCECGSKYRLKTSGGLPGLMLKNPFD
eukprot:TRINITY_DN4656_c0_g1_i5.p1 TRINITY_DN4656_c0_g1~~TRINITY_DN4656_c0_g1_i5.p1  ORF type:complete len:610 (+),score=143.34 TRINITY_DN4656_c0_g1_i5:1177-3006(+)